MLEELNHGAITPCSLLSDIDVLKSYKCFFKDDEFKNNSPKTNRPFQQQFWTKRNMFDGNFVKKFGSEFCKKLTLKQVAYIYTKPSYKNLKSKYFFWWYAIMVYYNGEIEGTEEEKMVPFIKSLKDGKKELKMAPFVKLFMDKTKNEDYDKYFEKCEVKETTVPKITHFVDRFDRTAIQKQNVQKKFMKKIQREKKYTEAECKLAEEILKEFVEFENKERIEMVLQSLYLKGKSLTSATLTTVSRDGASSVQPPKNGNIGVKRKKKTTVVTTVDNVKKKRVDMFLHGPLGERKKTKKKTLSKDKQMLQAFENTF